MKKLQNNYTTPEQSKRLLELGVPEWTADLRYRICKANDSILGNPYLTKGKKYIGSHFNSSLPCWSVGRLIEIYHICVGPGCSFTFHVCFPNLMNEIIYKIAEAKSNGWLNLDKLEDDESR